MNKNLNFIVHRTNTVSDLDRVRDVNWGCEIDLRSDVNVRGSLNLAHDPWSPNLSFKTWLDSFIKKGIKGPLILNTKEDGLEDQIIESLKIAKVENYFFLDTTLPTLVKFSQQKNSKFAVRFSSYEPLDFCLGFAGQVEWCWIDCFGRKPLDLALVQKLKSKFRLCMVSPELHGGSVHEIENFKSLAELCENICTKNPEWYA